MKSQVLHTVWCYISGEAAGKIWNWSLLRVLLCWSTQSFLWGLGGCEQWPTKGRRVDIYPGWVPGQRLTVGFGCILRYWRRHEQRVEESPGPRHRHKKLEASTCLWLPYTKQWTNCCGLDQSPSKNTTWRRFVIDWAKLGRVTHDWEKKITTRIGKPTYDQRDCPVIPHICDTWILFLAGLAYDYLVFDVEKKKGDRGQRELEK